MTYYLIILLGIWYQRGVYSYESGSSELNKVEITPYYDTIIFGDVADILNEFVNANSPLEALITSGSGESDENMEDLLSEYQVYLDKAHKQKIDYIEKNRANSDTKNKVPLIRHERFSKNKPGVGVKYDDVHYNAGYYNPTIQQQVFTNPIDLFLPASQKITKFLRPEFTYSKEINEQTSYDKKTNNFPMSAVQQRSEPVNLMAKKPCKMCMMSHGPTAPTYMLPSQSPVDGDGKSSALNSEYMGEDNTLNIRIKVDIQLPKAQDSYGRTVKNRSREEDINSKEVSVNVPFPYFNFPIPMNIFGYKRSSSSKYNKHDLGHHKKKKSRVSNKKHKKKVKVTWADSPQFIDIAAIPYRLDERNLTDYPKKDNDSYQQVYPNEPSLMYLEKSEFRANNATEVTTTTNEPDARKNETQTDKSIFVMVNISSTTDNITEESHKENTNSVETDFTATNSNVVTKQEKPQGLQRVRREVGQKLTTNPIKATNVSSSTVKVGSVGLPSSKEVKLVAAISSDKIEKQVNTALSSSKNKTTSSSDKTGKQVDVALPNSENNKTINSSDRKTVNQVAEDSPSYKYTEPKFKEGYVIPFIQSRVHARSISNKSKFLASSNNTSTQTKSNPKISQELKSAKTMDVKKYEKVLTTDNELTYWPESIENKTVVESVSHNITTIILEREHKKAKLNMTKEAIRANHTTALEKAIFGEINWDDVDTVAPVFMSFVGKYINGKLTFCSQDLCHSMKCSEKSCVHRLCQPKQRWNQRGHCVGSDKSDSVASLESIMDLPSNVAFEIVDILQAKMLGKMYGSATLCITAKCVSFVASKRNFLKSKCSVKELYNNGQCPTAKKSKLM